MKKVILFLIIINFFICCEFIVDKEDSLKDIKIEKMYNYQFINDIEINSVQNALNFCKLYIQYKNESKDYWQLPEETYNLKTGDCEDFCIFFMYLLKTKLNIDSQLVLIQYPNGRLHTLAYLKNIFYEPIYASSFDELPPDWDIVWFCSYEETIWMTFHYHNNVGIYY